MTGEHMAGAGVVTRPRAPFVDFRPPPDDAAAPALLAAGIGTVDGALAFAERERRSPSQDWTNRCESFVRQCYALPALYSSAELHANSVPSSWQHGHESPSRGDIALMRNGRYGHVVLCTGVGWQCYTNDYGGRGRIALAADLRDVARWCGSSDWYIADAYWTSQYARRTHGVDDMALTDDDVARIADAVWARKFREYTDTTPSDGEERKIRTTADLLCGAQSYAYRASTSGGGSSSGSLSSSDVQRIATATADLLAARLKS